MKQMQHAESNLPGWESEYKASAEEVDPWPFTKGIENLGRLMRQIKVWLPLLAGISFLIALIYR